MSRRRLPGLLGPCLLAAAAARALPSLELDPRWPATGVTLSANTYSGESLLTLPDGEEGMYFAWQDVRGKLSCCRSTPDIYAQRLGADGRKRWGERDLPVCTWGGLWGGEDILAGLVPDGHGGVVVGWIHRDGPNGTFVQRVDPEGTLRWSAQGATALQDESAMNWKRGGRLLLDGACWMATDGPGSAQLGIRRVGMAREPWTAEPAIRLDPGRTIRDAMLLPGERPEAVLAVYNAEDGRGGLALRACRIPGSPPAAALGSHPVGGYLEYQAIPDGAGGVYVAWERIAADGTRELVAQRASSGGEPRWGNGVVFARPRGPGSRLALAAAPPRLGVAWVGPREDDPVVLRVFDGHGRPANGPAGVTLAPQVVMGRRLALAAMAAGWLAGWVEPRPNGGPAVVCALAGPAGVSASVTVESRPGLTTEWERLVPLDGTRVMVVWKDDRVGGYPNVLCVRRMTVPDTAP